MFRKLPSAEFYLLLFPIHPLKKGFCSISWHQLISLFNKKMRKKYRRGKDLAGKRPAGKRRSGEKTGRAKTCGEKTGHRTKYFIYTLRIPETWIQLLFSYMFDEYIFLIIITVLLLVFMHCVMQEITSFLCHY